MINDEKTDRKNSTFERYTENISPLDNESNNTDDDDFNMP